MNKILYRVLEKGYQFDSYGREYWEEKEVTREAIHVYNRPHNYSDSIDAYYAADCTEDEAERVCNEFNDRNTGMFSPSMRAENVPFGMLFVVREPYDD